MQNDPIFDMVRRISIKREREDSSRTVSWIREDGRADSRVFPASEDAAKFRAQLERAGRTMLTASYAELFATAKESAS